MPQQLSDADFATAWRRAGGSPAAVARSTGISIRQVYKRRASLAEKGFVVLDTVPGDHITRPGLWTGQSPTNPNRLEAHIDSGIALVASDCHYWPGEPSVAHRAFLSLVQELQPTAIILNGDILDGARISRHDRLGWQEAPTLKAELEAVQERVGEIEDAAPAGCKLVRTIGNHCARFDRYLSMNAPEVEGLPGTTLREHLPKWDDCYSLYINGRSDHPVMVKHRYSSGVHAGYNNAMKGGVSMVTGHLHRLLVTPWGDYRGRRWGVDTGSLADQEGPQFAYTEDNPSPHCSGFAVLTFDGGRLITPELCEVLDGVPYFRGKRVAA